MTFRLDRHGVAPGRAEHEDRVGRAQLEVVENGPGEARNALDEHRLPLAIRAGDLGMEGHRQLDERMPARIRAVSREHLLHRNAGMAGAERVHDAAAADRCSGDRCRRVERRRLRLLDPIQHVSGLIDPSHVVLRVSSWRRAVT
jgi:hypothetical protein